MDYNELKKDYSQPHNIPYEELLKTNQWTKRRNEIIERDLIIAKNVGRQILNIILSLTYHLI